MAVAYWVDYGCSFLSTSAQWRLPIALQVVFAVLTIGMISFLPDTPRWFLAHDRVEEAVEVLKRVHHEEGPEAVERDRLEIATAISQERLAQEHLGGKGLVLFPYSICDCIRGLIWGC